MALKKTTKATKVTKPTAAKGKDTEKVVEPEVAKDEAKVEPETEKQTSPQDAAVSTETSPQDAAVSTELAVDTPAPKALSTSPNRNVVGASSSGAFEADAAEEGMDGLEIGYGSFPNVKLDSGEFVDGDNNSYPNPMYFTPLASRAVLAFSQKDEDDGDVFFSYDGVTTTRGESVAELTNEWKEDGYTPEKDTRLEVDCMLQEETEEGSGEFVEGDMVMFSLPPTARKKFSGKFAMARRTYKNAGLSNDQIIMTANVGSKVKVGNKSFNPWTFGVVKPKAQD